MVQVIVLGILLEVGAAALGTTSKQMIASTERAQLPVAKRCFLGVGLLMNIVIGPLVDASAYFFAPQTVIAPFASLDVIFNAISAPCTLAWQREYFTWKHFAAAFMVTAGASSSAYFSSAPNEVEKTYLTADQLRLDFLQPRALAYFAFEAAIIMIAVYLIRTQGEGKLQGMMLAGSAGLLMGNVFLLKGFVSLLSSALDERELGAFLTVTPYALLVGAVAGSALGTYFMQWGLRKYKGVYLVTIFEGMHICCGCASGDVILQEMADSSWQQWVAYWASVGCVIGGICLINHVSVDVELADGDCSNSSVHRRSRLRCSSERRSDCDSTRGSFLTHLSSPDERAVHSMIHRLSGPLQCSIARSARSGTSVVTVTDPSEPTIATCSSKEDTD